MYRQVRDHPSFSSSLLDQIYSSIDDRDHHESIGYRIPTTEKQSSCSSINKRFQNDVQRENSIWMPNEVKSDAGFKNSSSSSSDSATGGSYSSSEAESVYGVSSRLKPIRTSTYGGIMYQFKDVQSNQKDEGKLVKTKSRAMKIYGDLKKVKQPISPGGPLSAFLNSLFTTGNLKNTKLSSFSANESPCSSAMRFVPVSVIDGDDYQHALKLAKNRSDDELRVHSNEKTRSNIMTNYEKKVEYGFDLIKGKNEIDLNYEVDDDDDDGGGSNTSSDLFELENFSAIGLEDYGDELPVFETTHLNKKFSHW